MHNDILRGRTIRKTVPLLFCPEDKNVLMLFENKAGLTWDRIEQALLEVQMRANRRFSGPSGGGLRPLVLVAHFGVMPHFCPGRSDEY